VRQEEQEEALPGKLPFTALYSLTNEDLAGPVRTRDEQVAVSAEVERLCLHEISVIPTTRGTADIG
jgi:hypothetical protein